MGNSHNKISTMIDKDLKQSGDKGFTLTRNRLVGKEVVSYGVKTSEIRKIVRKYRKKFQELRAARDCFEVASELISKKILDDQMAGIFLLGLCQEISQISNITRFKRLIIDYINNWAVCDAISSEVVARVLKDLPEKIEILYSWARSDNKWLRRVALVTAVKLKNRIPEWNAISSRVLLLFSEEQEPIVKSAMLWLKKELDLNNLHQHTKRRG